MNVLDLFSGIGGFSVGLEATGKFKTIGFCEKDKFCQKVLQKHWQGTTIFEDIRDIDGTKIKADVITGGFPCQPFSTAGKRKGTEDDRYLFPEMLRIIKETQARWVVGENVQGIVNMSEGKVLQGIHNDLETIGYEVQSFIIPASSQGAWHKRNRVWIVAANANSRLSIGENKEIQTRRITSNNGSQNVSNSSSQRPSTQSIGDNRELEKESKGKKETRNKSTLRSSSSCPNVSNQIQIKRKHTSIKMSGSTSKESWWETQSELCGVPDGVQYELYPDRANRIKALGNAIVPQIATEIGKAIIKAEEEMNGIR